MGKHVQWVTHKGKRILLVNCAGLREAEYLRALEEYKQVMLKERSAPLVLVDLTGTEVTTAAIGKAKDLAAATKAAGIPYGPNVVVGLSKVMKSVASLSTSLTHYADTVEEGQEWLVQQDQKRG